MKEQKKGERGRKDEGDERNGNGDEVKEKHKWWLRERQAVKNRREKGGGKQWRGQKDTKMMKEEEAGMGKMESRSCY